MSKGNVKIHKIDEGIGIDHWFIDLAFWAFILWVIGSLVVGKISLGKYNPFKYNPFKDEPVVAYVQKEKCGTGNWSNSMKRNYIVDADDKTVFQIYEKRPLTKLDNCIFIDSDNWSCGEHFLRGLSYGKYVSTEQMWSGDTCYRFVDKTQWILAIQIKVRQKP